MGIVSVIREIQVEMTLLTTAILHIVFDTVYSDGQLEEELWNGNT